jgi:putative transposase
VNHKRVFRLYQAEHLAVRRRRRKRVAGLRAPLAQPARANERWSMDFVTDALGAGRSFRVLSIVDDRTRECLALEPDISFPGRQVAQILSGLVAERGQPAVIVSDNGPEFAGRALDQWAYQQGVRLHFIERGKPIQNAYVESFQGKLRDECLNGHWFLNLADARRTLAEWRTTYNRVRPHSALGYVTPEEFARADVRRVEELQPQAAVSL